MAEKEDKESGVVRGGAAVAAVSPVDLMAKVDIRGELKADLMKELGDKRSKIRGKALQKVGFSSHARSPIWASVHTMCQPDPPS